MQGFAMSSFFDKRTALTTFSMEKIKGDILLRTICHCAITGLLVTLFSSCATILSGTSAKVTIDGDIDEPVTIVTSKDTYKDVNLPTQVLVSRKHLGGQHIRITSPSHAFHDIELETAFNPTALGSLILLYPVAIDLITNAVVKPSMSHYYIRPVAGIEKEDSIHRIDSIRYARRNHVHKQIRKPLPPMKRHTLSVGVGIGDNHVVGNTPSLVFPEDQRNYDYDRYWECGDIIGASLLFADISYHYRLNRKWEVGATAAWGIFKDDNDADYSFGDFIYDDRSTYGSIHAYKSCRYFAVLPSVRYTWGEELLGRCYSGIALGFMRRHLDYYYNDYPPTEDPLSDPVPIVHHSLDKVGYRLAYHVSAIGLQVGTGGLSCFGELGYGCLGIFRIGLTLSF